MDMDLHDCFSAEKSAWAFGSNGGLSPLTDMAPEDDLVRRAAHPDPAVREFAARDSNTPDEVLRLLISDPFPSVLRSVASNPNLSPSTDRHVAAGERVDAELARNPRCPVEVLDRLALDTRHRASVAANLAAPWSPLCGLLSHDVDVAPQVASNPSCDPDLVHQWYLAHRKPITTPALIGWGAPTMRGCAIRNPVIPAGVVFDPTDLQDADYESAAHRADCPPWVAVEAVVLIGRDDTDEARRIRQMLNTSALPSKALALISRRHPGRYPQIQAHPNFAGAVPSVEQMHDRLGALL